MSELANFAKQVQQCSLVWEEVRARAAEAASLNEGSTMEGAHNALAGLWATIAGTLLPAAEKLKLKMGQVDPVSGQKRYGPSSVAKLSEACTKLELLQSSVEPIFQQLDARYAEWKAANSAEGEVSSATAAAAKEEEIKLTGPITIFHSPEQAGEASNDSEETQRLRKEAEEARERQLAERQRWRMLAEKTQTNLQNFCDELCNLAYRTDLVDKFADILYNDCKRTNASVKEVVGFVVGILDRIVGRPDDQQARRLRLSHPVIWSKLGSRRGGLQLLAALGFLPRVQLPTVDPSALDSADLGERDIRKEGILIASEAQVIAAVDRLRYFPVGLANDVLEDMSPVLAVLAPHTQLEVLLEMQEPAFDAQQESAIEAFQGAHRQTWIQWFDGLKENQERIRSFL